MSQSGFNGLTERTFSFLADLQANNTKEWFDNNRARYDADWKAPSLDLISALAEPMRDLTPSLKAEARLNGTLRRINRDVRFSKDKSPYNPRIHLIFWTGSHPNRSAAMHFVIHSDSIGYGAGVFGLTPAKLSVLRDRIMDPTDRAELLSAISAASAVGCAFDPPDLKRLPQGYSCDADWEHLLRRKALVMRTLEPIAPPGWLATGDAVEQIMALTRALMPLIRWLA